MAKQILAYTEYSLPNPDEYVKYLQAFIREDKTVEFRIRDSEGKVTSIAMDWEEAIKAMEGALRKLSNG